MLVDVKFYRTQLPTISQFLSESFLKESKIAKRRVAILCPFRLVQDKDGWAWLVAFGYIRAPALINHEAYVCLYKHMYIDLPINLVKIKVRDDG